MKSYLGMYVHAHRGYNRQYAARSWSVEQGQALPTQDCGDNFGILKNLEFCNWLLKLV